MAFRLVSALIALLVLSACVPPPASEMERQARLAAAAELAARNCAAVVGGFAGIREMREDANRRIVTARELGATDADLQKARQNVSSAFTTMVAFTTPRDACNNLVGELAWQIG